VDTLAVAAHKPVPATGAGEEIRATKNVNAFGILGEVIRSAYTIRLWRPATTPGETHLWQYTGTATPGLQSFVSTHVRDLVEPGRANYRVLW
jgi:hypothetical protein